MQQQSNMQNKFLIDADIGDDDVTLPNLPAVDVPIIDEPAVKSSTETPITTPVSEPVETQVTEEAKTGGFLVE
jgi:fused signal recognition particle receptor